MQPFSAYLQSVSPETIALLKHDHVSFRYREKFEFQVMRIRKLFDQLSNSPHIDKIKDAAGKDRRDVRISFVDSKTGIEYVTLIAHTRNGVRVFRS
jgi:hypothetical protein